MSAAAVATGRTTAQVARTIRRSIPETETILVELALAGIAEQVEGGVWRLSAWGEARYGRVFRELHGWLEAGSV